MVCCHLLLLKSGDTQSSYLSEEFLFELANYIAEDVIFHCQTFHRFKILNFLFVSWCEVGQHETDRIGSDKTGDTIPHIP